MAVYHTDEISFDAPDGWVDGSVNVLMDPRDAGGFSLAVTRQPLAGQELAPFVSKALKTLAATWPRFVVLGQRERKIGPLDGREARVKWAPKGQMLYQHQVYVPYYGKALIFTGTTQLQYATHCEAHLNRTLSNIRFRKQA
jgi:hypothetical protein